MIPLVACAIYIPMVFLLPKVMASREKLRLQPLVIAWNFGLSLFSFAGLFYCVPALLWGEASGLFTTGFYPSVCSHASSYGFGKAGFFVFLFIYSKLAELIDTLLLVLRKSPVILLHWCLAASSRLLSSRLLSSHLISSSPLCSTPPLLLLLAGTITSPCCSTAGTRTPCASARACGSRR